MTNAQDEKRVGLDSPEVDALRADIKESNDDRKAKRLLHKAEKADAWRVQVWAQSELRIRAANAELQVLGREPFQPMEPDFADDDLLRHYANMTLPK